MFSTIAFIIFLIFIVTAIFGGIMHIFFVLTIGLSVASLCFIAFTLTFKKNSKNIKKEARGAPITIIRIMMLIFGFALLLISFLYVSDVPNFLNKNYKTVEGIPTQIKYAKSTSKFSPPRMMKVVIKGKSFKLHYHEPINQMKGHRFTIYYLPNSDWIIGYKIEGLNKNVSK